MPPLSRNLAIVICCVALSSAFLAAQPRTLEEFLASLPNTVDTPIYVTDVDVSLCEAADSIRLSTNGSVIVGPTPQVKDALLHVRIALPLRSGDNLITIDALKRGDQSSFDLVKTYSTHIFRTPHLEPTQYVVLAQGQASNVAAIDELRRALILQGIRQDRILEAANTESLASVISDLTLKMTQDDQLLVYYSGSARINQSTTEPILQFGSWNASDTDSLSAGTLIINLSDIPRVSLLLDINYSALDQTTGKGRRPRDLVSASGTPQAAPWLQNFSSFHKLEIAYTNPFASQSSSGKEYTTDFVKALLSPTASDSFPCKTFSDIIQRLAATNSDKSHSTSASWPLYYDTDPSEPGFCFTVGAVSDTTLSVELANTDKEMNTVSADVTAAVPAGGSDSWCELFVDGVLLVHSVSAAVDGDRSAPLFKRRIFLEPGSHFLEIRIGHGLTSILANTKIVVVPGATKRVAQPASFLAVDRTRKNAILESTILRTCSISFVGKNTRRNYVQFRIRNNGVVVREEKANNYSPFPGQEIVRSIPLSVGENNVSIEVFDGDRVAGTSLTILRRAPSTVHAVVIGVDSPGGIKPLAYAVSDAESMKRFLLQYTDTAPSEITLLTGTHATRAEVVKAISRTTADHMGEPFTSPAIDTDAFLLYFAGYGTTLRKDDSTQSIRCILLSDFDIDNPESSCLSTVEIDRLLDLWRKSIVIFDTSYDGLAGVQPLSTHLADGYSRTLNNYLSDDISWRLSAGIDRPDRIFLVASNTNSPALEVSTLKHGVFTSSIIRTVEEEIATQVDDHVPAPQISLFKAFSFARNLTVAQTSKRETPVIKGVLSSPFSFVKIDPRRQADAIVEGMRQNVASMHHPNWVEVSTALTLYEKVLALQGADQLALLGKARTLLYQSKLEETAAIIETNLPLVSGSANDKVTMALWLTLRAELRMRRGDLDGALADCERAVLLDGSSLRSKVLLGELRAARLQYPESSQILESVLDDYRKIGGDRGLSQEEVARIVLLAYISLRRSGSVEKAQRLLLSYISNYSGSGGLTTADVWSHAVSNVLISHGKHLEELEGIDASGVYTGPDKQSLHCLFHFYVGMAYLFNESNVQAQEQFRKSLDTKEVGYAEFWIAKSESSVLPRE